MAEKDKPVTPERIQQMAWGYAPTLILEAAVRLGVFDLLDAGPMTAFQVAAHTGASQRGARMLLNALTAIELLAKKGDAYALTPESATYLVSTKPGFAGGLMRHLSKQLIPHWLHLTEAVQSGKPPVSVNQQDTGGEFFRAFVEDLFPLGYASAKVLANHLLAKPPAGTYSVLDLAAGSGVWSIALAEKSPQVRVTVVDWPAVIPVCQKVTTRRGVADRYRYVPGDLLEADFAAGHQAAALGHILHSEGASRSQALLKKTFTALAPGGVIAIAEMTPNEDRTGPPYPLIFALNMLVHTDEGDTFTFGEISGWLRDAGFVNPRQLEVPAPSPLILVDKPK
ncbi:MAG TPA: methyltransferase dimerization domain-containing protein [Gemmataceae bacterium]|nr:methyltransferase dimerization domain-containing protein [Gemmataceae bacterium]